MPANRFNGFTDYGVGMGLRIPHYQHIFEQKPVVDWFEIISENYNNETATRKASPVRRVAALAPTRIWLAVHRQEFMVYYKRLQAEENRMLTAIQSGAALGEVFALAFINSSMDEAARASFLQECFHQWAVLGWLYEPKQSLHDTARLGWAK